MHILLQKRSATKDVCPSALDLSTSETLKAGENYVVRFKMPKEGSITTTDLLRGSITTENNALDDTVSLRVTLANNSGTGQSVTLRNSARLVGGAVEKTFPEQEVTVGSGVC